MAAAAARSVIRSPSLRNAATRVASSAGTRSAARPATRLRRSGAPRVLLRSPVEMGSFFVESLMPMHSVTASALMTSMLVVSRRGYGWLLEVCNDDA